MSDAIAATQAGNLVKKSMRVVAAYTFDDVRLEERTVPEPGHGEALVRVRASGLCTGDLTPWYISQKAKKHGGSVVLGHEAVGEIVARGEGAPHRFQLGDRIIPHHHAPCLEPACPYCRRNAYVQCPAWTRTGFRPGGMAEYMIVDANCLANDTQHIPDDLSDVDASLTEPTACCVKALAKRAGLVPGGTLVILGLGVMGMLNLRVATALHDGPILAVDLIEWRLEQARRHGAHATLHAGRCDDLVAAIRERTGGHGAESILCGPGHVPLMRQALDALAPGGTVCYFMSSERDTEFTYAPFDAYFRELTITHSYSAGPDDMRMALQLIQRGVVRAEDVVTRQVPLEELPQAYRDAATPGEHLKTVVVPHWNTESR